MTASWKERKGVAAGLAVVALAVWGAVGHALWTGLQRVDEPGATAPRVGEAPATPVTWVPQGYEGDFRDPFLPQLSAPPAEADEQGDDFEAEADAYLEPAPVEPQLPPMRLVGVVGGRALVEVDGFVQLVRRGDFIEEVEVVDVRKDEVSVALAGEHYLIPLH